MDQNKPSYIEFIQQFAAKATAELSAVVIILLSDLFFIYKSFPLVGHYKDHIFIFHGVLVLTQIMIFALCLRILWDHSFSALKKKIGYLKQYEEKTRKPKL